MTLLEIWEKLDYPANFQVKRINQKLMCEDPDQSLPVELDVGAIITIYYFSSKKNKDDIFIASINNVPLVFIDNADYWDLTDLEKVLYD